MADIELTIWQRMNLEGIISRKRRPEDKDFLTIYETWNKIKVPDIIRKSYAVQACETCGLSRGMFDMDELLAAPTTKIDIEKAEARILLEELAAWKDFAVSDGDWLFPLKAVLNSVIPDGEKSVTKTPTQMPRQQAGPKSRAVTQS